MIVVMYGRVYLRLNIMDHVKIEWIEKILSNHTKMVMNYVINKFKKDIADVWPKKTILRWLELVKEELIDATEEVSQKVVKDTINWKLDDLE